MAIKQIIEGPTLWQKIQRKFLYRKLEGKYLQSFYSNTPQPSPSKGKVLLYSVIGSANNIHAEILFYHLLKKEGYDVQFAICQGALPACEILTKQRLATEGKKQFCNNCNANAVRTLKSANIPFITIKGNAHYTPLLSTLENKSLEEIYNYSYEGIDFGHIVKGVSFRYFKSSTLKDNEENRSTALRFLKAALMSYTFVNALHQAEHYDLMLFSHGIYTSWEPIVALCKQQNIEFLCYDRAKQLSTMNFNMNEASPVWEFNEFWEEIKGVPLKPAQEQKVSQYLKDRELQSTDVYSYNPEGRSNDLDALRQRLKIKKDAKVITLYTNLIWDAANVFRDIAFPSATDWILETINWIKEHNDLHLLIRLHPAEKVLGTDQSYQDVILERYPNLPENVSFIQHADKVNSFSVIDITEVNVIHTSTVGIEAAIANKATILVSNTHYRGKGFTYDVSSPEEYFETILNITQSGATIKEQVALARKYFYYMMFVYQKEVPITFRNRSFNGYTFNNFNALADSNVELIRLVKSLEKHPKHFMSI